MEVLYNLMKLIFVFSYLLISHMQSILGAENVYMKEIDSDITVPLILETKNVIFKDIDDLQSEVDSCWGFVKFIKILFRIENDEYRFELDETCNNFFPTFPYEIILHIDRFLDPLSTIMLSQTCTKARMMFSSKYWESKCQQEKLQFWSRDISPDKVYIANFWYKTQQLKLIKRAAAMGHPESKKKLNSMQANPKSNAQQYKEYYLKPRSPTLWYGKFSGEGYYYYH